MRVFILCISIMFASACQQNRDNEKNPCKDVYLRGVVVVKAEELYPMGLIKSQLYDNYDAFYEEPLRGIVFNYDSLNIFNLNQEVMFKVKKHGNLEYADAVKSYDKNLVSHIEARYPCVNALKLNLHLAEESHREGPFHRYGHIVAKTTVKGSYQGYLVELTVNEQDNLDRKIYYIDSATPVDTSKWYFFEITDPIDTIVTISTTHDHKL